jgi:outer membrane usher protein
MTPGTKLRGLLAVVLVAALATVACAAAEAAPPTAEGNLMLYSIKVNGQEFDVTPILRLKDGALYARRADLESWRLNIPAVPATAYNGEDYFPLVALEGSTMQVDDAKQALTLDFSPQAFAPTLLGFGTVKAAIPATPGWGGFANYDLYGSATKAQSGASGNTATTLDGAFEFGMYTPLGALVSSELGQNLAGNAAAGDGSPARPRAIRLETTFTHDLPGELKSLQFGDTIGVSGIWGLPVRYGGIHWGTNFATQPGFVTIPLPSIGGQAALPSTVELYINGLLRQTTNLAPGPFQLNNLPAVTGQGEAQLVVRDILGRTQTITQPFYASSILLKEGLSNDSYELGFVRENFGTADGDYGPLVGSMTLRKGVTDSLTTEFRGELTRDQRTAGYGASVIAPIPVVPLVLTASGAVSQSKAGLGELVFLAAEHQSQKLGFGLRSQWTTPSFAQEGLPPGQPAPRQQASANLGFPVGAAGTFGMSFIRLLSRTQPDSEIVSASYSMRLGKNASLNFTGNAALDGDRSRTIGVTLVFSLDERSSVAANTSRQSGVTQTQVQLQQSLPAGSGYGYRLLTGTGAPGDRGEADLSMQTDSGTYELDASRGQGVTGFRLSASGGIAFIGGRAIPSRTIGDAFGVVEVPDNPGVGVLVNNQVVAHTDSHGFALVPRLSTYQINPVRIDPSELPLDAQIDSPQVDAVPYFRSGLSLKFPVKRASGALIVLVLDDGKPMPLGAMVTVDGAAEEFQVAQRGEVYVTGLTKSSRLRGSWRGQSCDFGVEIPADAGPVPNIGPLKCSGVQR